MLKNRPPRRHITRSEYAFMHKVPYGKYTLRLSAGNYQQETTIKVIKEPQSKEEAAHIRR